MKNAIELISDEIIRIRNVENYSVERDDKYVRNELALAAVCYAIPPEKVEIVLEESRESIDLCFELWPWGNDSFKPTPNDRIRELVKAGAFIASEIERYQRMLKARENKDKKFSVVSTMFSASDVVLHSGLDLLEAERLQKITPCEDPYEHIIVKEEQS